MDEAEKRIRQRLKNDFEHYAAKCLKIRTKSGEVKPFLLNKAQRYINECVEKQKRETGMVRAIIVKGRQEGCSTYIEGRFYWIATHHFGVRAFILTHDTEATNNLFEMAQRYYENCPRIVRPTISASNAKELIFAGLDSGYKLGTAGNKAVGRSSTIQLLHASECAYWPNAAEHAKGIFQAVPNERNTEIFIESTANGLGNFFHEQWQLAEAGQSEFIPIFIPWYWQDEYSKNIKDDFTLMPEEEALKRFYILTNEQLNWRRAKIVELSANGVDGTKAFNQEYPNTSTEAFVTTGEDTFILSSIVLQARKQSKIETSGNLLIGIDPARFGDDRTSIVIRRGREAYKIQSFTKKDTMEIVGIVHRNILEEHPVRVFIDIGGLGAGIFDRLCELGWRSVIVPVNGGATPLDQKKYFNKRAEMWGLMKLWLEDIPCKIPDLDSLHADLCGIRCSWDSQSRLKLERKEDMKKRGLRSPDEADALALTFALPDTALIETRNKQHEAIARGFGSEASRMDKLRKAAYKN